MHEPERDKALGDRGARERRTTKPLAMQGPERNKAPRGAKGEQTPEGLPLPQARQAQRPWSGLAGRVREPAGTLGEVRSGHALLLIISILQSGQTLAPPRPALAVPLAEFRCDSAGSCGGDRGGDFRKQRAPARVTCVCVMAGAGPRLGSFPSHPGHRRGVAIAVIQGAVYL